MLEQDITAERKQRHSETQEDFTPQEIIDDMFEYADDKLFTNFEMTYLDTSAGTGNILLNVLKRRLEYCNDANDIYDALKTLFGVELIEDNVKECKKRLHDLCSTKYEINDEIIYKILDNNIICADALTYNYDLLSIIKI